VNRVATRLRRLTTNALVRIAECETIFLGSGYGGWHVVPDLDEDSIVYSAGIGDDSTFDLALIERFGCTVEGFDPTPVGRAEGEGLQERETRFRFHPWGLWDTDATIDFYAPRNPDHASFSITNLQGTEDTVPGEVRRLRTVMENLGHGHIDLLKMDIEGAEHAVIADLLTSGVEVRQLCVEFNQPSPFGQTFRTIRTLQVHGFRPVSRQGWDYTFLDGHH
jgi:FkbM family methyltransferase